MILGALDPGGTSGLAWGPIDGGVSGLRWEQVPSEARYDFDPEVSAANRILLRVRSSGMSVLVIEGFNPRPGTVLKVESFSPIRIESMVKFGLAHKWSEVVIRNQPASMKSTWNDERLIEAGVPILGPREKGDGLHKTRDRHALDAIRHWLIFADRLKTNRKLRREVFG